MSEAIRGACHCKAVQFEVVLDGGLASARRCDCSLCRMRGAVALSTKIEDFKLLSGEDALSLYQFNTMAAEHYFCSKCGIYTHHKRRSNPHQYGFNAACLEGVSPFDFGEVKVLDGQNHPKDTQNRAKDGVVGYLRFEKAGPR